MPHVRERQPEPDEPTTTRPGDTPAQEQAAGQGPRGDEDAPRTPRVEDDRREADEPA